MDWLIQLLPHLVNGVSLGLLFALIALGFMLIVGVMETINLAHGSLFALGMYFALFFISPQLGWFPNLQAWYMALPIETRYLVALFLAPVFVGLFGMLLELCMRRTYGRDPLYGLLLTFGAALVIEETIRVVWGSNEKQLALPEAISGAVLAGRPDLFQVPLFCQRLCAADDRGAVAVPGENALRRHHQGRRARQRDGARAGHQPAAPAHAGVWHRRGAGGHCGRGHGAIWGIRPHVGVDAVVPAFLIIVLGGVGSLWGAVIAGLMVGMVVGLTGAYASEWSLMSMYLLFIAVVTFRSRGLFGKKSVLDV
jgi:branched-chain amino acid transport system permease protein